MTDLFSAPLPPPNPYDMRDVTGWAAYEALLALVPGVWHHKQRYEQLMAATVMGRLLPPPVGETPGRYLRFIRDKLDGTGWTVLNDKGDVCMCQDHEADALKAEHDREMAEVRSA